MNSQRFKGLSEKEALTTLLHQHLLLQSKSFDVAEILFVHWMRRETKSAKDKNVGMEKLTIIGWREAR